MKKLCLSLFAPIAALVVLAVPRLAPAAPQGIKYIPADSAFVIGVNIAPIRGEWVTQQLVGLMAKDQKTRSDLARLEMSTGLKLQRDVHEVLFAMPKDFETTKNFLLVARGKFNERGIVAFARKEGSKLTPATHSGVRYYTIDSDGAILFDGDHFVMGPPAALKAAIDTSRGKMQSFSRSALAARLNQVSGIAGGYFVADFPASLRTEMKTKSGQELVGGFGTIGLRGGMSVDFMIEAANVKGAQQLAGMMQAALREAAKDSSLQQLGLDAALSSTKVASAGTTVSIRLGLKLPELQKLVATFKALMANF